MTALLEQTAYTRARHAIASLGLENASLALADPTQAHVKSSCETR
jgi:hypothetical protein